MTEQLKFIEIKRFDLQIVSNSNCLYYRRSGSDATSKQPGEFIQNAIMLRVMILEKVHSTAGPSLPDIVFQQRRLHSLR